MTDIDQLQAENKLRHVERLLSYGRFRDVDLLLACANVTAWSSAAILAVATITAHAKTQLDADIRDAFIKRAEDVLVERIGSVRTAELLRSRR